MNVDEVVARLRPDHRAVVRAALCEDAAAAGAAWREWRSLVEFDLMDEPSTRLLPLIARRGDVVPADDPVRRRVHGTYRRTWVSNHRLWQEVAPTIVELSRAGVPVMVLKGGALLHWYGDDWGVRPMYDVDLGVPVGSLGEALAVLERSGWTAELGQTADWVRWRMRRSRHSWGFASANDGRLDLHWRVLPGSMWDGADRGFWSGSSEIDLAGVRVARMHPADLLVHVLLHGVYESNRPPLQWMADVVHLTRGVGPAERADVIDRFVAQARLHGALRVGRAGLGAIRQVVGEASVEPFIRALDGRDSVVERLRHHRGPGAGQLAQWSRNATGGAGVGRGLAGLAARRIELDLVERPVAMALYVAGGRSPVVARALRRRGPLVRVPAGPSAAVGAARDLVFELSDPWVLDRVGATGWGVVRPAGADTMGREARLLMAVRGARSVRLEVASRGEVKQVEVVVNDRRVGRAEVGAAV
ncbi:MAG: hypothetical protein RI958_2063, partial [Actinomycetota bacterium]